MSINLYKDITKNKDILTNRNFIIGSALASTILIATVSYKRSLNKKKELAHQEAVLSDIVSNMDLLSNKIISLSSDKEQLEKLSKQNVLLKDGYTLTPY